jgi:ABC-type nitrate/sulfonate/bicarbonate transport system substrate-binding protein
VTGIIDAYLLPLVERVVEFERAGRHVVAAAALAKLRERYAAVGPDDLAADEQTWADFARKHVPLPPDRIDELIGRMVCFGGLLRCTKCGAGTACPCCCGAPYVGEHRSWAAPIAKIAPALERAAAAVAAHPEKSNRFIAAEIGVAEPTVRRARRQLQESGMDVAPGRRIGRDGVEQCHKAKR